MSWTRTGFTRRKADLRAGHPKAEKKPQSLLQSWQNLRPLCRKEKWKKSPTEFFSGTVLPENGVLRSVKDQTTEHSSHRGQDVCLHKIGHWPSESVLAPPRGPFSQHKPCSSYDPGRKQQVCTNRSDQKGVNEDGRLKPKFIRKAETNRELWGGIKVAEVHERKLQTVRMCANGLCSSFQFEWGGSFKLQKVHGQEKTCHRPTFESQLADFVRVCVCVSVCVLVILRSLRSCQPKAVPAETALWCSVTSLMMYVKAHQYLDASWGKLRFFHFLCTHLHIFSMRCQTY